MRSELKAKQAAIKEIVAQMMAELTKGGDRPLTEITLEQIVLQAETYTELHNGLGQISASGPICSTAMASPMGMSIPSRRLRRTSI